MILGRDIVMGELKHVADLQGHADRVGAHARACV